MWLPLMGLICGLLLGSVFAFALPTFLIKYMSIAVLASLDSLLGGFKAVLEDKFDGAIMISGFFINSILAAALAYLGDLLGLDLHLAAVIAFGIRIFNNMGFIRRGLVQYHRNKKARKAAQKRRNQNQETGARQYETLSYDLVVSEDDQHE